MKKTDVYIHKPGMRRTMIEIIGNLLPFTSILNLCYLLKKRIFLT